MALVNQNDSEKNRKKPSLIEMQLQYMLSLRFIVSFALHIFILYNSMHVTFV